jgi:nitrite reductase (NO-forming)
MLINLKGGKKMRATITLMLITFIFGIKNVFACDFCNKTYAKMITDGKYEGNILAKQELFKLISLEKTFQKSEIPSDIIQIIERDKNLPIPQTSYVSQDENIKPDKSFTFEMREGEVYLGKGVIYKGFNINGTIPGPTVIVDEGDIVEFKVINKGSVPHGMSIHAAYTQTSKYLGKIMPGETRRFLFKVTYPGVYMYHCAPGGHAIMMHTMFGQYGMIVVRPKKKYKLEQILNKKPDVEIYLIQHEVYSSGNDAIGGKPLYVMFNGQLFRYVENPIMVRPGDYVRIYFLNVGTNQISTFHIVGIIWDYAYWQGHPDNVFVGGQSVLAGPTDSWVIEFRIPPDEGDYTIVSHAFGSTDRGAVGLLRAKRDAQRNAIILAEGPKYSEEELKEFEKKAIRIVSTFQPGTEDVDPVYELPPYEKKAVVRIIGNSFYPKVLKIKEGTTVEWINEDVFTYAQGEFAGIHNVAITNGPETFAGPLLGHAEKFSYTFKKAGEYHYMCSPHPYMKAKIIVDRKESNLATLTFGILALIALGLSIYAITRSNNK